MRDISEWVTSPKWKEGKPIREVGEGRQVDGREGREAGIRLMILRERRRRNDRIVGNKEE